MLTLFSVQLNHPRSRVVIVDNASPARITAEALRPDRATSSPGLSSWFRSSVRIVRRERDRVNKREYGSYATGVEVLANSTGLWAIGSFEQFVFMQGSIILSEPVPPANSSDIPGCEVRPFQSFGSVHGGVLAGPGGYMKQAMHFLRGVGLLDSETELQSRQLCRKLLNCALRYAI